MAILPGDLIKLFLAILVGGSIGLERELHHKAAGFRTITLICVGATLFTMMSIRMEGVGRIAANIITGVSFLGAGVIIHEVNRIKGLTTAATIWVSAAMGMAIGAGVYLLALLTLAVILIVMILFARIEHKIGGLWEARQYEIVLASDSQRADLLESQLLNCGLHVGSVQKMKIEGNLVCILISTGSTKKHNLFVKAILADPEIKEIKW